MKIKAKQDIEVEIKGEDLKRLVIKYLQSKTNLTDCYINRYGELIKRVPDFRTCVENGKPTELQKCTLTVIDFLERLLEDAD